MSIANEILRIQQAKQAIKEAINNKGGALVNEKIEDYATAIDNIPSGGIDVYSMLISEGLDYYKVISKALYNAYNKDNLFEDAWNRSLTVDPSEISANSSFSSSRGLAQYPNGDTEGIIIPHGVTRIGTHAFRNGSANNQPLVIPNSVTSIDSGAFTSWSANNQPLIIPNSVISISSSVFQNWTSNNQPLLIPNSVTSIGSSAFYNWNLVPYVEIQAITPPTLPNANTFGNQNNAPIYVPDESVEAYKTATNWVNSASRIFSINDK